MRNPAAPGATRTTDIPFGLDLSMAVFDRATRLANSMFTAAGASIILAHDGEIWRSRYAEVLPAEDPVTLSVLQGGALLWVEDGRTDPRFADHPLVTGPPFLRFTVAVPIRLQDGSTPGALSVSGMEPQPFDAHKAARLKDIADFVADEWVRAQTVAALATSLRERDQALERIERSEERLKIAIALADIHVWELDYVRRELTKAGAEDTFFAEPQTYQGLYKDIYVTIDPRDRAAVQAAWKDHVENGAPYRPEHRINRPDGREIWGQSSVELFTDETGRPTRMVGAIQNITGRKRAEQALLAAKHEAEMANKAKSGFLATMSHELRTPLNAILGFAEIIKDQIMGPAPDAYVAYARHIHASGRHLLDLVDDVLDIAKLEAGKIELQNSEFDPRDLVSDVVASLGQQAETAQIALRSHLSAVPKIRADRRHLKQVLLNVISNALKFTPAGGTVTVAAARASGSGLKLWVSDTGIGMSKPQIEIALTPFGQIDSTIARRFKGTGLGLPISHALMKLHGGDLRVDSEEGKGTRVTVTLPEDRIVAPSAVLTAP
ncbi:MAG TPA: ATP-binding protein [Stellaceae bacterium]|nr:ATP-binding protein [Stellaceae bacterium]